MPYATVNPATGLTEKTFDFHSPAEVEALLARAVDAFADYRTTSYAERARHLVNTADLFEGEAPEMARIVTTEMGKTFAAARGEASKCAMAMRWFAEHAESLLADQPVDHGGVAFVRALPADRARCWASCRGTSRCGRSSGSPPPRSWWATSCWSSTRRTCPRRRCCCEDAFLRAGVPRGVVTNLFVASKDIAAIIEDPRIAAVSITGSEQAGMSVAATAGHALKKSVLELGGSDPFIVLASADLDVAVKTAVTARIQNNGQSCIAAKRFIVVEPVADEFLERFTEAMDALVVGDPFDPQTQVGPIVSEAQREELLGQIEEARRQGATVHGGVPVDGPGWYLSPAVLSGVTADMSVAQEELFGPVAIVERVPDLRRGHRGGQLDHLRAGIECLDERRGGAAAVHRGDRGRCGVRQRHGGLGSRTALRGDQAVGVRA